VAESQLQTAKEAEVPEKEVIETPVEDAIDDLLDYQKLDCIYDEEPLGFEEDPMGSTIKMKAQDLLEEVDLGDGSVKRPTYVSAKIPKEFKDRIVELLKDCKDCFAWDYNEFVEGYFWLGIVEFVLEGYLSHFGLGGILVILRVRVIL
jgi:hypothetical protein